MIGLLEASPAVELAPASGKGDFFQIDVRVWRHVLAMGINHAVALMVLARGSGGDNATTSWSTDAVERYTGVSRPRAKQAIDDLEAAGVLDVLRGGTKPLRRIRPAHEIPGCSGSRTELTDEEAQFMSLLPLKEGQAERSESRRNQCEQIVRKGHAEWRYEPGKCLVLVPKDTDPDPQPQWVWLPNALVDGVAGEIPPLELVRQTQSVSAMRMLVEAYHYQRLEEWGGLDPLLGHDWYEAEEIGRYGQYRVWRFFQPGGRCMGIATPLRHLEDQPYWVSERPEWYKVFGTPTGNNGFIILGELGLAEWVPCLFEAMTREAELIHAIGHRVDPGFLSNDEFAFAKIARETALKMVEHRQLEIAETDIVVALPAHFEKPHMRGVLRMRYRPHTAATARWCAATAGLVQVGAKLIAAVE